MNDQLKETVDKKTEELLEIKVKKVKPVYLETDKDWYKIGKNSVIRIDRVSRQSGELILEYFHVHYENGSFEEINRDFVMRVRYEPA